MLNGSLCLSHADKRFKRFWFIAAAVFLGFVPLFLLELGLAMFGLGEPSAHLDPYAGFSNVYRQVFVPHGNSENYGTSPAVLGWFEPQLFPVPKPRIEFRVFVVGGSTVQGRPYGVLTSFSTWLELLLQAMDPTKRYRVVNVGGISYASYRLLPIVDELLNYEPDLLVIYSGHNEFLEDRTYETLKRPNLVTEIYGLVSKLRTYNVIEAQFMKPLPKHSISGSMLGPDVQELLNSVVGLDAYHRNQKWQDNVVRHYRHNLRAMIGSAQAANVPVILVNPVSNVSSTRPFKSVHGEDISTDDILRFSRLLKQSKEILVVEPSRALQKLKAALAIDPRMAEAHFLVGKAHEALANADEALNAYERALEFDVCPLRILEVMRVAVSGISRETVTPLLDAKEVFEQKANTKLFGAKMFVDHVHPTIEAHQLIAAKLSELIVENKLVFPQSDWSDEQIADMYLAHLSSLDDSYFFNGRLALAQVLSWAHRYDEAEIQLRNVIVEYPSASAAYLQLGQLLARLGRVEEAALAWEESLAIDRTHLRDLLSLGLYESSTQSYSAARLALETYLSYSPPKLREIEANFGLAVLELLEGNRKLARELYSVLEISEENLRAAAHRASGMGWFGHYESKISELEALQAGFDRSLSFVAQ